VPPPPVWLKIFNPWLRRYWQNHKNCVCVVCNKGFVDKHPFKIKNPYTNDSICFECRKKYDWGRCKSCKEFTGIDAKGNCQEC